MLNFAMTLKLDWPPAQTVALTQQAEEAGFAYAWVFDSHILWMEPYPLLTLMAANTKRIRLGTCVTNPAVRDPTVTASLLATLDIISGGRMDLGIGRGDSSRRVLGKRPTTLVRLAEAVQIIRDLVAGREVNFEGQPIQMTWARSEGMPVWVAGYGPKALRVAGQIADGVILQFADPELIAWSLNFVRQGAEEVGRDFSKIQVMSAAPSLITDDMALARHNARWFGGMVGNHVADLVKRYDDLPPALVDYIRKREGYNYRHHAEIGSKHTEFVPDDVVDRFCVLGTAEQVRAKLQQLVDVGVTQFNIYLMAGDEHQTLDVYGREIIPAFRAQVGSQ